MSPTHTLRIFILCIFLAPAAVVAILWSVWLQMAEDWSDMVEDRKKERRIRAFYREQAQERREFEHNQRQES